MLGPDVTSSRQVREVRGLLDSVGSNLERMEEEISILRRNLQQLVELFEILEERVSSTPSRGFRPSDFFEVPDSLRKTLVWLFRSSPATAETISTLTKRSRTVESGYLNELVRQGYAEKNRRGHKIYYSIVMKKAKGPIERMGEAAGTAVSE